MFDFENTELWHRALARREADPHAAVRDRLRDQFLRFRDNAGKVADEIHRAYPTLTVHGITHLDALWEMADIILGPGYPLNPAEAFVLGGAFLVHDLGNGLAAYQGGEEELRSKKEWRDALAARIRSHQGRAPKRSELNNPSPQLAQLATEDALRFLHARQAEKLALVSWKGSRGEDLHLIEDPTLRTHFGKTIGEISYSHWWSPLEVGSRFAERKLGSATFMPREWTVDLMKAACVLRVADAAHIDERRAPRFLMALRRPQGLSKDHWTFQSKLSKPDLPEGRDRLVYTAGESFSRDEADAFWICFDTLQMINRELRDVDALLADKKRPRFAARGVADAEDAQRMAGQHIATEGWVPIDARLHVSDLPSLISHLGGAQLYGDDPTVPLRELIQNAADAVRARRALGKKGEDLGRIVLRQGTDENGEWLEVEDTGLGMSERVLMRHLLDFGKSYWASEDMRGEHPGLAASAFQPTGRFGIGFFSVFMWSERLRVTSRPFKEGEKTRVLEFHHGLSKRPLLRLAEPDEQLPQGGTRVRVWIANQALREKLFHDQGEKWGPSTHRLSLVQLVRKIAPTLDVTVDVEKGPGQRVRAITANDWLRLDPVKLLKRTDIGDADAVEVLAPRVRPVLLKSGRCVGRACVEEHLGSLFQAVVTVGGLRASGFHGVAGVLLGHTDVATRNEASLRASSEDLARWAAEQEVAWTGFGETDQQQKLGRMLQRLGATPIDLPILWIETKPASLAMLEKWAVLQEEVRFLFEPSTFSSVKLQRISGRPGSVVVRLPPGKRADLEYRQALLTLVARSWGVKSDQLVLNDPIEQWSLKEEKEAETRLMQSRMLILRRPA